jgi:Dolichyl-phosphate-mannose-protein mannosyltransferase
MAVAESQPPDSATGTAGRYWTIFAAAVVLLTVVAGIWWSLAHPLGIHWDEAGYLNDSQIDVQRLRAGSVFKLGGRLLLKSWGRPPAFRIFALPFLGLFGATMRMARLVSLACFLASTIFIYLGTRLVASRLASAFAVLIFCLSPEVLSASIFYGTDAPLYLCVSALFYFMLASWTEKVARRRTWIGLGLAIGFGFLAKTSFAAIVVPVLLFWWIAGRFGHFGIPKLESQLRAALLAFVIAAPWWALNLKASMAYAQYARGFVRNSLGSPSVATWLVWLNTAIQSLLGIGIAVLIGLVVIAFLRRTISAHQPLLSPLQRAVVGVCACGAIPITLAQLSGTNHLLRHITPAMIPLAIATGVLADAASWGRSGASIFISSMLFSAQFATMVLPLFYPNTQPVDLGFVNGSLPWRVFARFDQWDWRPVMDLGHRCQVEEPKISYLGNGRAFNDPQIRHPWIDQGKTPDVNWLWRYEDGPLDWQKVMNAADQSDVVVTAPDFSGEAKYKEHLDNQHNTEFANRLSEDPHFRAPVRFQMGRFQPVEVWVFVNSSLTCSPAQMSEARP